MNLILLQCFQCINMNYYKRITEALTFPPGRALSGASRAMLKTGRKLKSHNLSADDASNTRRKHINTWEVVPQSSTRKQFRRDRATKLYNSMIDRLRPKKNNEE